MSDDDREQGEWVLLTAPHRSRAWGTHSGDLDVLPPRPRCGKREDREQPAPQVRR